MFGGIAFRGLERDIVDLTGEVSCPSTAGKQRRSQEKSLLDWPKVRGKFFTCCSRDDVSLGPGQLQEASGLRVDSSIPHTHQSKHFGVHPLQYFLK